MTSRLQTVLALVNTAAIAGVLFAFVDHQRDSRQELEELRAQVRKASTGDSLDLAGRRAAAETAMRLWAANAGAQPSAARAQPPVQAQTPAPEEGSEAGDVPPPPPPRPPPPSFEQSRTRVFTAFAEETVDNDWSGKASQTLNEAFRQHLPASSRVKSLDCRATLCRVELVHRTAADHGALLMNGLRAWPGSILVASEAQEGADYVVTLLASKEGTRPPL
ncbi:hypothetical protein D7Y13_31815 [Corallococcus praedator]|uniref:Dihydrolipoamide acetyltransferase n=1 Tax=Corallococcus praedator TaxID=2316724 RepID=A0ABX9Q9Q6_9BACT|nr:MULTISPECIES: hypothetical protein [Corallococcus]RKH12541.1 hypothetical protein D7X74_23430 [Corallococcus sp. CA047B]RKH27675.1 hypothetical protein D7X75_26050 [Corallococcus sp. CA031C]RKH95557.1 hypothetical protein D7Y13_31815 [Corallococcus praedator]